MTPQEMQTAVDAHHFWILLSYIVGGFVAFGAGFLTCFFMCNYSVVSKAKEICWLDDYIMNTIKSKGD